MNKIEPYFRSLKKKLHLWLEENVTNTIISTGGGFLNKKIFKILEQ